MALKHPVIAADSPSTMSPGNSSLDRSAKPAGAAPGGTQTQQGKTVNAYLHSKVMSASPQELRLMLLDGAIRFANQGREALANKNFEGSFNGFSQCREIIIELLTTIRPDTDPALAKNVKALYTFMYKHLVEGVHEKDFQKIGEVIELLMYERETWVLAMEKAAEETGGKPVASRPAGLTASLSA